jgi:hypothetical protein
MLFLYHTGRNTQKKRDGSLDETVSSNEQTKKISHMNVKVEAGRSSNYITSVDTEEVSGNLLLSLKTGYTNATCSLNQTW